MKADPLLVANRHRLLAIWLALIGAYHMAWIAHPTAAFTLNAFDLAEQVGIHPAIAAESPPLRTAGLLRIPIPLIATGIAITALLYADIRLRWLWRLAALGVALRVIPPESALRELGTINENDYALQLLILTLWGVGSVLLTIFLPIRRWFVRHITVLQGGVALATLILPMPGLYRGIQLLEQLGLSVSPGGGVALHIVLLVSQLMLLMYLRKKQHGPGQSKTVP